MEGGAQRVGAEPTRCHRSGANPSLRSASLQACSEAKGTLAYGPVASRGRAAVVKRLLCALALASVALIALVPVAAQAAEPETWWLVPAGVELEVTDHPQSDGHRVGSEGFPQTLIGGPGEIPCGRTAQVDVYRPGTVEAITADGVLTEGEDYAAVVTWRFVYGGDCESGATPPVLVETGSGFDAPAWALFLAIPLTLAGFAAIYNAATKREGEQA